MEGISIPLQIVAVLAVGGALVETFLPGFISNQFQSNLSSITIASIGILLSFSFLMWFLKLRVREGFEDTEAMTNWKQLVNYYKLDEICELFPDIYSKILTVQKGIPPSTVTDAQAREKTDQLFLKEMKTKLFSCTKFQAIQDATTINPFFEAVHAVDNDFFVQAYETLLACRILLIRQYNEVQVAKSRRKEGFQNEDNLCEPEVEEERRKMLKEKYLEAQKYTCKLPEELPTGKKEEFLKKKLATMAAMLEQARKQRKDTESISKILEDCRYYMAELEKDKKAAENGTIGMPSTPSTPSVPTFSF